ncbi:MAG: hypothetical protein FWF56_03920 [Firmicutes bacterium]|nr:hypothetical protein [Bacillota bacterium]MCL1944932.1 hypothetical protein [Bacillota bacterium]MCL1954262.1 hypothetical protein [Bacillota bacterium]
MSNTNSTSKVSKSQKETVVAKLKKVKHIEFYVAGLAIALMLIVYFSASLFSGSTSSGNTNTTPKQSFADYQDRIEQNLKSVVGSMKGVGKTEVAIAWESSIELVLAYITINNGGNLSSTPQLVTENGTTKPLVIKEIYPDVIGVALTIQGGDDARVRLAVIDTVCVLLSVSSSKVVVQSM